MNHKILILILILFLPLGIRASWLTDDDITTEATDTLLPTDSIVTIDSIPALPWPQSVQAAIDTIIAKSRVLHTSQMGMMVYDLTADSVLYEYNAKQTMRPASTMKVLTAITALENLGGAYLYKTRLCYTGKIDSLRTLRGDLYCVGGMDPMLGADDLKAFARSVREAGIDTIRGYLCADKSMKDADLLGEGWCWDDDNPTLSALVYNRKDELMEHLRRALVNEGVVLYAPTRQRELKSMNYELSRRTHTVEQVLHRMMKQSDNLYAESMFYQLGLMHGKPSTPRKSRQAVEALLNKMGKGKIPHRFADGSGLSLYNYVTPEIEVAFLRYAHSNDEIYSYFYPSMPIAGVDGTLAKRMKKTPAANNIHAKTGTVTGISSLAGYATAPNGHVLCFSIINQGVMKSAYARAFQDKICIALCKE